MMKRTIAITLRLLKNGTGGLAFLYLFVNPLFGQDRWRDEVFSSTNFRHQQLHYKPLTWWHWINGNVSKEGIRKDLLAIKDAGIGGVQLFDAHMYHPAGPIRFGTPQWYDHVNFAIRLCDSLNLEFHLMNSPGWSGAGGPWVTPDQSMKQLVFSEIDWRNSDTRRQLPQPEANVNFYRDIAVLAVPTGKAALASTKEKNWNAFIGMEKFPLIDTRPLTEDATGSIPLTHVVNLTRFFDTATQVLHWQPPPGNWTILRFGYTTTGKKIHPAVPEGTGYEIDKLDPAAVAFQFGQSIGPILEKASAYKGKTIKGILFDSWEAGFQNWTEKLPGMFLEAKGYDLIPYLPVVAGRTIGSPYISSAFLWDFRNALTKMISQNYYGTMQRLAHEAGMVVFSESQGGPMSPAKGNVYTDVPMNEFWTNGIAEREARIKQTVSIANILGRKIVGAEAFTSRPEWGKWQNTPYSLKATGDYAFTTGINRFIFHTYAHQPFDLEPGFTMGRYGTHFSRTNTWWKYMGEWTTYLSRCQYMLQQGRTVADVCFLFPDDVVYEFPPAATALPPGYNYDLLYQEHLEALNVVSSKLQLKTGPEYRIMVLPDYPYMAYTTLQQLFRLVQAGAVLLGPPPVAPPDLAGATRHRQEFDQLAGEIWSGLDGKEKREKPLGKGRVYWGLPIDTVLAKEQLAADLLFLSKSAADTLRYIHKTSEGNDVYFISNQADAETTFVADFRVSGRQPELWDPATGKTWKAPVFDTGGGRTKVHLGLPPRGSLFVVFRKQLPKRWIIAVTGEQKNNMGNSLFPAFPLSSTDAEFYTDKKSISITYSTGTNQTLEASVPPASLPIKTPWTVSFLNGRGAPPKIGFSQLLSWSEHPSEAIRYYAGTARYTNRFTLSPAQLKDFACILDLGEMYDIAAVRINGKAAGILWKKPYAVEITSFLREGSNRVEVDVTNRWINRLIGDERLPADYAFDSTGSIFTKGRILAYPAWLYDTSKIREDKRYTFTTWKHYTAGDALQKAGLLGPVKLVFYNRIRLPE